MDDFDKKKEGSIYNVEFTVHHISNGYMLHRGGWDGMGWMVSGWGANHLK